TARTAPDAVEEDVRVLVGDVPDIPGLIVRAAAGSRRGREVQRRCRGLRVGVARLELSGAVQPERHRFVDDLINLGKVDAKLSQDVFRPGEHSLRVPLELGEIAGPEAAPFQRLPRPGPRRGLGGDNYWLYCPRDTERHRPLDHNRQQPFYLF